MIARIARAIAFARHVPPAQLLWRVRLTLARRAALRRPPDLSGPTPQLATVPPQPVFAPRTGMIARGDAGWRMTFVGRTVDVGDPVDWTRPSAGARYQLWRMNLHYFEYLEQLDAGEGRALIRQWIAANPPYAPGSFADAWNSYALSLRVLCWMQFLARTGAGDAEDILESLAGQMRFLEGNLERDLGGNHLIKNIKALCWAGAFFAGQEAARWRATGERLLAREIATQILDDGVHYERSPSYHAQVLADLIETAHALGDDRLDAVIARMTQAAIDLAHPDGRAALLNDAGLHMAYRPAECAGAAGIAASPARVFAYRRAGLFGAHLPALSIIADMGRIGADSLPAHAHGDVGTFELSVDGQRIVVDQGVYEYVAGARRDMSRAAHAHASLAIDGIEQADFFGAFRCGRRPDVRVTRWTPSDDGFVLEGEHGGYARLPGRPRAIRRFTVDATGVRIDDRLTAAVDRTVSLGLLLHPDAAVALSAQGAEIACGSARLTVRGSGVFAIEEALWWPDMGVEVPTRRLRLTWGSASDEGWLEIRRSAGQDIGA